MLQFNKNLNFYNNNNNELSVIYSSRHHDTDYEVKLPVQSPCESRMSRKIVRRSSSHHLSRDALKTRRFSIENANNHRFTRKNSSVHKLLHRTNSTNYQLNREGSINMPLNMDISTSHKLSRGISTGHKMSIDQRSCGSDRRASDARVLPQCRAPQGSLQGSSPPNPTSLGKCRTTWIVTNLSAINITLKQLFHSISTALVS